MLDKKLFLYSDKIKHIIAFFVLSYFIFINLNKIKKIYTSILLILFAGFIEILQIYANRQADIIDFMFSVIGVLIFLILNSIYTHNKTL